MRRITIGLGLSAGLTLALSGPVQAQTLVVTKFDDPVPVFCVPGLDCSLREAVTSANGTPEADTIVLAAGTYTLTLDALDTITTDITIQGQGAAATVITGADTTAVGAPAGGVVAVTGAAARLTVRALTMSGNRLAGPAGGAAGGAIAMAGAGALVLDGVALRDNRVESTGFWTAGGALGGEAESVTITDSAIEDNVYVASGSAFGAGGIALAGSATPTVTITRSSVSRNRADLEGATASEVAGGILMNSIATLSIADSTVSNNIVGSSRTSAQTGGMMLDTVLAAVLTNVTLTDNVAGPAAGAAGNLETLGANTTVRNSVAAGGVPSNCTGPIGSGGGNLDDGGSCGFTGPGDLVNVDPQLGVLRANGGLGRSRLPLPTSPLFGLARSAVCSTTDQRGIARPTGDGCDSGAVESTPPPASTVLPSIAGTAAAGQTLTCAPGTFTGAPALAFQWLRDGTAVPGAITASYTVTAADLGTALQCQMTATNPAGTVVATSPAVLPPPAAPGPAAPANTARPTFGGPLRTGLKTTCTAGTWSGATGFAFAWLRNGTTIAGAADAAYTLKAADAGKALQCRVTASGAGGSTVAESAPAVPAKACIVPTLIGTTLATARTRLTRAGCALGRVTRKLSTTKAPGLVLSSSPAKGKNLAAGAKVALTLSRR